MSISNCTFSMVPLHNQAHKLTIDFEDATQKKVASNEFLFKKTIEDSDQKELHDICSQNGICSDAIISTLFNKNDVTNSKKIIAETKNHSLDAHNIFVLDIKGKTKSYLEPTISTCEETVLNFFKEPKAEGSNKLANQMHELFKPPKLDYLFNEGSLKAAILKTGKFTDSQIDYLQEGKIGPQNFCQIAEFVLTAFKMGFETDEFKGKDYIKTLSNAAEPFKPHATSITFYPPSYAKLYNPNSEFFKTQSSCFKIHGELLQSKVSIIKVENKTQ